MKNFTIIILLLASMNIFAQTTSIPDANFEQALIDLGYDTGTPDGTVPTANISGVTTLSISFKNIADLTGIEYFTSLTELNCSWNQLTNLDISENTSLIYLDCFSNELTNLDISENKSLTYLDCSSNELTNLDISENISLIGFDCSLNQLSNIDVSENTSLTYLRCWGNQLTSLDVSTNIYLTELECGSNELTNIDVSANTALTELMCDSNQLVSLDLTTNTSLTDLFCYLNNLISLNISTNTSLTYLWCWGNQLTSLDVRNENNESIIDFDANYNPNLTCIFVDDKDATYLSGWAIDEASTFVETETECEFIEGYTYVPDDNFEQELINLDCDDVLDNYVLTENIKELTSLNISEKNISDLTGIEDFINLTILNCSLNQLTTLDVTRNKFLTNLSCFENQLSSLNLLKNSSLIELKCHSNQLRYLNLTYNYSLTNLSCYSNQLVSLDVRNGNNTNISVFILNNNPDLKCIYVDDATWSTENWTNIDATSTFVETYAECDAIVTVKDVKYSNFTIYPNPTKETFSIKTDNKINGVKIYDVFGKLVEVFDSNENYNVSSFAKGIYLVYVKSEDGVMISKLIIE